MGLLNSSVLEFYIKHVNPLYSGRYYIYDRQYLEKLPIIYPQTSEEEDIAFEVVNMVERILKQQKELSETESSAEFLFEVLKRKDRIIKNDLLRMEVPPDADAERVMREYKGDFEKIEVLKRAIKDLDKSMDELVGVHPRCL